MKKYDLYTRECPYCGFNHLIRWGHYIRQALPLSKSIRTIAAEPIDSNRDTFSYHKTHIRKNPAIFSYVLGRFWLVSTSQRAWITPGIPPRSVSMIFIQKCVLIPTCKKAATGGRKIARMIFRIIISRFLSNNRKILFSKRFYAIIPSITNNL